MFYPIVVLLTLALLTLPVVVLLPTFFPLALLALPVAFLLAA